MSATRRSLVEGLANWGDHRRWQDFHRRYAKLLYGFARKAGLTGAEAEDAVQETLLTVARRVEALEYDPARGSFKGWLLQIARWRVADQFRKRDPAEQPRRPSASSGTGTIARALDPAGPELETVWDSEWQAHLVATALRRLKDQVSPRQYQIFDCYVVKGWPAERVVRDLHVNFAQVYLAKHRVGAVFKKEVEAARASAGLHGL